MFIVKKLQIMKNTNAIFNVKCIKRTIFHIPTK